MHLQSDYVDSRLDAVVVHCYAQTEAYETGTASAGSALAEGACSVREIQETFPELGRPAYTTVQTVVYRLERKKALHCVKRISNANIFEAMISRKDAQRRFVDELLAVFGGRAKLVMAHLVESGELTLEDIKEAEKALRKPSRKEKSQ
jgi:BlaI family penicillinase repressor